MKVLIVGSGGREHALAWKIKQSPLLTKLYCIPGNPGTAEIAENVELDHSNLGAMAVWAVQHEINLTIIGPEAPLAAGIVDIFEQHGLRVFGPRKDAAKLETSKSFAKEIMQKAGVKTAHSETFSDHGKAKAYIEEHGAPVVIKADGLAAGKGVTVATTVKEALQALDEAMQDSRFGEAGNTVVVEDMLVGREASIMVAVDGESVIPLAISQDYKRLNDDTQGPNTGGMGAVSPSSVITDERIDPLVESIILPVIRELQNRGISYRGFLYAGVMVSPDGEINVLEFNCRLGDPETQVLMMRLQSDLLAVLDRAVQGNLSTLELQWSRKTAVCVVASSKGYPGKVEDKKPIDGVFAGDPELAVFQAGTTHDSQFSDKLVTKGGRVLSVAALGATLEEAREKAYAGLKRISFEGMHYRKDIGLG